MAKIDLGKIGKAVGQGLGGLLGGEWQQRQDMDAWQNRITGETVTNLHLKQQMAQQQLTSNYADWQDAYRYALTGYSTNATTLTISPDYFEAKPPKKESALEWLDRRVTEMRVKL